MRATRGGGPAEQATESGRPPDPDSPLGISKAGWRATLARTLAEIKQDRVTLIAAGVALFWFLAIFPLLIAGVGLTGLLHITPQLFQEIQQQLRSLLPGDADQILIRAISRAMDQPAGSSLVTAIFGMLLALWSASSGMAAVQVGLDVAYDVPEDRPLLKRRLMGLFLTLITMVLAGVATAFLVFGEPIGEGLRDNFPGGDWFFAAWTVARWVLTVVAVTTLFALFYFLGPNRKPPSWKWLTPGGAVAVIVWLAASFGFSFYVSSFGSYAKTYGSLAGVIVLVLWLYLSALALLLGAELNGELERQRQTREGEPKAATPGPG